MRRKVTIGGILLLLAGAGIIGMDKYFAYCKLNPNDAACPGGVTPTPTPSPTASPTPEPSPSPTASPTPEVTPTPVSPPTTSCVPDSEDPKWGTPSQRPTLVMGEYTEVLKAVGDRCGFASPDESKQIQTLELIASKWGEMYGRCAARWADSVAVRENDGLFSEFHAVYFGNGCTISNPNAYKGAWPYNGVLPDSCPIPQPSRDSNAWRIGCKPHNNWIDCTPNTVMTCEYCKSIGMGEFGGKPRCGCPMRNEEDPNRFPCELYVAGGQFTRDSRNGVECIVNGENPLQFRPNNGNCRICNADKTVCGEWF